MKYLGADEILLIHSIIIDETSGSHGVRDRGALLSVVESPKQSFGGKEIYSTIFEKAAVYARGIIMNHPFIDGNKRVALIAMRAFLFQNGFHFNPDQVETVMFLEGLAAGTVKEKELSAWLRNNSQLR